jgi:hypothetical protein
MDELSMPILMVGGPNQNGRVYPRDVINKAIEKLDGRPLNVVAYDDDYQMAFKVLPLGQASNIRIDDLINQVVADIKFDRMPKSVLPALSYGVMGTGVVNNGTVSDFTMTGVGIRVDPAPPSCGQTDS